MKYLFITVFFFLMVASCTKIPELPQENFSLGKGVFILNEGNFRGGNGSLSFFSYDSMKIYNNLFDNINGRPLGDVPNSMIINADKAYIVVNNSGKVEVLNQYTLESNATITGLISPRNVTVINYTKAYVSSLYSDSVIILDLLNNSITGYISLRRSSESIVVTGSKAYISNWMGGKEIMVINTLNNKVVDSIEVGPEPESMVIDKYKKLWVLCNGGWARQSFAELISINTTTNHIEKKFLFSTLQDSPSSLQIDGTGTFLYYLDKGVRKMDINSTKLPEDPLIPESGGYFYKIGIDPVNNDIFITDAVDFMQQGYVLLYRNSGTFVSKQRAYIIPGSMCFNL